MNYFLNTTGNYHVHDLNSLGWELTVCNALYPETSPCRNILQSNSSFGIQLYRFLDTLIPLGQLNNIIEVGGGLGYLMSDFLKLNSQIKVTMLDISPYLLAKQKEILSGFNVNFLEKDILNMSIDDLGLYDLVIMNENLGDLPTLVANSEIISGNEKETIHFRKIVEYFKDSYNLSFSDDENINIGAMEVLDRICKAQCRCIYLSEHSCETSMPASITHYHNFTASGNPEKIKLKGHNEYTIKFSNLQKIAETCNYKVLRGQFADFLPLDLNQKVLTAMRLETPFTTEQEIIQQFVYDLYKYEYMVMIKI